MDAEKIRFPFVCRRWRQGDWLIPFGMRGKKKISDLFTDLKYSILEKESSIMIVDVQADSLAEEQHVAALLGVRMDDRYKVTAATKKIVRMSVLESE
jgi:tRNA(Ile)-lysidine synthase